MKKLLLIIVLSLAVSAGIYYINSNVIISKWTDSVYEIGFMAIPVFIVIALLYYVNKALLKTVKRIRKKPSV